METNDFLVLICNQLSIDIPNIKRENFVSGSETTLAYYDGEVLHLRKKYKLKYDLFFAIAHELRHAWQIKNKRKFYFENYKTREELDVFDYNMQPSELDANAYAMIAIINIFDVQPSFDGLDDKIKEAIKNRAFEIIDTKDF